MNIDSSKSRLSSPRPLYCLSRLDIFTLPAQQRNLAMSCAYSPLVTQSPSSDQVVSVHPTSVYSHPRTHSHLFHSFRSSPYSFRSSHLRSSHHSFPQNHFHSFPFRNHTPGSTVETMALLQVVKPPVGSPRTGDAQAGVSVTTTTVIHGESAVLVAVKDMTSARFGMLLG